MKTITNALHHVSFKFQTEKKTQQSSGTNSAKYPLSNE